MSNDVEPRPGVENSVSFTTKSPPGGAYRREGTMRFHTHQALLNRTLALAALIALLAAVTTFAALRAHSDTGFVVSSPAQNTTSAKAVTVPAPGIRLGR